MKEKIKLTINRLQKTKNPSTFYLERLHDLLSNTTKEKWVNSGQYHNARTFARNNPEFNIPKEVNQVMFYAGEYVVCLYGETFKWNECSFSSLKDIENCIWETENLKLKENEKRDI